MSEENTIKEIEKEKVQSGNINRRLIKQLKNKRGSIRIDDAEPERVLSQEKKTAAKLMASRANGQILTMHVNGLERKTYKENTELMPVCFYEGWKIYIRKEDFIARNASTQNDSEEYLERRMYNYRNAEVDVIIKEIYPDLKMAMASRVEAMRRQEIGWWFGENKVRGNVNDIIRENSRVQARVCAVSRSQVTVEVFGVETIIPMNEVSYIAIKNCRELYRPGDRIFVRVSDIEKDEKEYKIISYKASIKRAYPDPRIESFYNYEVGGIYDGVVTMILYDPDKYEKPKAFVRLDGIDVICNYPKNGFPEIGDRVTIGVSGKNPDTLMIWGVIIHMEKQINR